MLRKYFFKRLLVAIPSLVLASLIVFSLVRLLPGDVVVLMMEENHPRRLGFVERFLDGLGALVHLRQERLVEQLGQ